MNFQVGDRVIAIKKYGFVNKGETGTYVHTETAFPKHGVMWDLEHPQKHNCGGHCENRHGWYVPEEILAFESIPDFGEISKTALNIEDIFHVCIRR